jgi:hypothetical protein
MNFLNFSKAIKLKDSITIKKERVTYITFYREFFRSFMRLNKGQDQLILAGLFLHLTFESLITYTIRLFINTAYGHNKSIQELWRNIFETERLDKKLDFFKIALLISNNSINNDLKRIVSFYNNKLALLRNRIVHGHEVSEITTDDGRLIKSKLAEVLTNENIQELYNEFWENTELFLNLFNKVFIPKEVNLSPNFINRDLIEGTKNNLKRIEEEFKQ